MSENSENSNNNNIWHEVTEKTKKLLIIDTDQNPFASGGIDTSFRGIRYLEPPECVIINIFDYPDIKLDNLQGMPLKMPNLQVFNINFFNHFRKNLKSLIGLPKELPKLKDLSISSTLMQNLLGFPAQLPSLEHLSIKFTPLESLQYLPKSLPRLENISIHNTNIENLEFFPSDVPVLKKINITRNKLVSLKGMPPEFPKLEEINLSNNQITSLEHLPDTKNKFFKTKDKYGIERNYREKSIAFLMKDNPIRTFAGIKFPNFFNIMIESPEYVNKTFQLCPTGLKLFKDYQKKKNQVEAMEYNINKNEHEFDQGKREKSIRRAAIVEFYRKTPMELAQQYIESPDFLSEDELERLGWEGGYQERQLLESSLPADHQLLIEISQRLTHELPSGLSILK